MQSNEIKWILTLFARIASNLLQFFFTFYGEPFSFKEKYFLSCTIFKLVLMKKLRFEPKEFHYLGLK